MLTKCSVCCRSNKEHEREGLVKGPRMGALDLEMEEDELLLDLQAQHHARS